MKHLLQKRLGAADLSRKASRLYVVFGIIVWIKWRSSFMRGDRIIEDLKGNCFFGDGKYPREKFNLT